MNRGQYVMGMGAFGLSLAYAPKPLTPAVSISLANSESMLWAGVYIALERGYLRDEGLDLQLINGISTPEQIAQLAAGHVQIGYGGPEPGFFNAVNRGIEIKVVAPLQEYSKGNASVAFLVRQDLIESGRYKGLKDFKGMNVALISPTSAQYYMHLALQKAGLDIPDISPVYMGFSDMVPAFASKRIDAAFVSEPTITRLEELGTAKVVLPLGDLTPGIRPLSMTVSPVFIKENAEALRRFLVAFTRGNYDFWHAFMKKDRPGDQADLIRIFAKYTRLNDLKVYATIFEHHGFPDIDPRAPVDAKTLLDVQAYYVKVGTQQRPADLSKVIDNSFMRDALARLGRDAR